MYNHQKQINSALGLIASAIIIPMLILVGGCGGTEPLPGDSYSESFKLDIVDDTYIGSGSAAGFKLATTVIDGTVDVTVSAVDAQNLKALMFSLAYDPSRFDPLSAGQTGRLDPLGGEIIESPKLLQSEPGRVWYGQILPWPEERDGLCGSADLVTLRFKLQADDYAKTTSTPPLGRRSQTPLRWDGDYNELSWYYYNSGDCNKDGVVGIYDIAPYGMYWKHTSGGGPFPGTSQACLVDYDNNGEINIADMSSLVRYFNTNVSGYNIYASLSADDYPQANGDPNGPGAVLLGSRSFGQGSPSPYVRTYYTFTVEEPDPDAYYWVRPVDNEDTEGTPSTLAGGPQ